MKPEHIWEQNHTSEPFVREPRYVVFKLKDIESYLNSDNKLRLNRIGRDIAIERDNEGKPPFNAVVVEQDWPEFDLVWEMIEARMTGHGNDSRRYRACVNACAGIRTEALEHRVHLLKAEDDQLAEITKQRDVLLAVLNSISWLQAGDQLGSSDVEAIRSAIAGVKGSAA